MESLHIIVTGASGFLGQHLLSHWMKDGGPQASSSSSSSPSTLASIKILALYNRLEGFPESVQAHPCAENVQVTTKSIDLTDTASMKQLGNTLLTADTANSSTTFVIHTAAMSSPRLCQQDPERARAINIPTQFFESVSKYPLIALSTDQVYDGKQKPGSLYQETEQEALKPANAYGQSKLDMENYLMQCRDNQGPPLFLLRSSIILGPPAPFGGAHTTFFDFCQTQGAKQEGTYFFTNEYRTVVSVKYAVQVIDDIILKIFHGSRDDNEKLPMVYNMGGSARVNRWDMAQAVFEHFEYDQKLIWKAEQTSSDSPLDISMDSSLLAQMKFGPSQHDPSTLEKVVKYVFL
jgi:dTDP-4-dehydrorhamnose reductase